MAMEKTLAPSVVKPPCAISKAWNTRTIVPSNAITDGPNTMAPKPVPVGCEHDPVTLGIFSAERTKAKAPAAASVRRACGRSATIFFTFKAPTTTNGAETANQPTQCKGGR